MCFKSETGRVHPQLDLYVGHVDLIQFLFVFLFSFLFFFSFICVSYV